MTKYCMWLAIWCAFCALLAMVGGCASTPASASPIVIQPTKAELQRAARVQMSNEHGCIIKCPDVTAGACVDEEGYCFTACAWDAAGQDPAFRAQLHQVAIAADPERSFLIVCPDVPGGRSI
jgi:hypothetical protein